MACSRPSDLKAKRNLTGVFQHWDCIDPQWNPGGIWAPVAIHRTGPVRISSLKVLCREANSDRATLELEAELDTAGPVEVAVETTVRGQKTDEVAAGLYEEQALAAGTNRVRWRVVVERPELWWPWALGEQPLYQVEVQVRLEGAGQRPAGGDDGAAPDPGAELHRHRERRTPVPQRGQLRADQAGPGRGQPGTAGPGRVPGAPRPGST